MATHQHALLRQWHMLQAIPRAPLKITVQELQKRLENVEFVVTERTIQRDLRELVPIFPLVLDERNKPFGWSWLQNGARFDLPGLNTAEALALVMVGQLLSNSLPPVTFDTLKPHFRSAQKILDALAPTAHANAWLGKVRTIAPMQRLLAPVMNASAQRVIYSALMSDCQLKLSYRKRDAQQLAQYDAVHPLAVIQRGQLIYLVCMFADYDDVRTLALHRVVEAEMLCLPSRKKPGFSLDAYIESGDMGIRTGEPIELHARFYGTAGDHLSETPLSAQQVLTVLSDDSLELRATIPNTKELQWWLLGLGDAVEVLAPSGLRDEMRAITERMAARYAA